MNDLTSNKLLDIVKNIYTHINKDIDDFLTYIYSYSFESYQVNDFDAFEFKLNKVNHLVWFSQGLFHKNTFEGP